jgi:rhodanese-related sulfurtransferase
MSLIPKIQSEELDRIKFDQNVVIIDIRCLEDYADGHIERAIHIDNEKLQLQSAEAVKQYVWNMNFRLADKIVVVYCESGGRSVYFAKYLQECGYDALSLSGGYRAYRKYAMQKFKYI